MKHILPVLVLSLLAGVLACGDDDPVVPPPPPPPPIARTFLDLSQKWHVLNNVELAYNKRNITRYDSLLDMNFLFFLSKNDVVGGLPDYWGREVEVSANQNLFSKEPPSPLPRCKSIRMDIQWETDPASTAPKPNVQWVELPGRGENGEETWYMATCFVNFEIDVDPDLTFISPNGTKATFVVRNGGTETDPRWHLVEMEDLGAPVGPQAVATSTEPATWGSIKAMFR